VRQADERRRGKRERRSRRNDVFSHCSIQNRVSRAFGEARRCVLVSCPNRGLRGAACRDSVKIVS